MYVHTFHIVALGRIDSLEELSYVDQTSKSIVGSRNQRPLRSHESNLSPFTFAIHWIAMQNYDIYKSPSSS
jgi:hypothetical protein